MLCRKSVLILQGEVTAYRQPIFNALAHEYDVTVLHSGRPSIGPTDRYAELIIPVREVGPFFYQSMSHVRSVTRRFDATVSMFDLRWPAFLLPVFGKRLGKVIFHGHRYSGNWVADGVRDFLMKQADCLLMYGDEEVGLMVERGIDPSKIIVAPNTIDVPNHADFSSDAKTSLLFVGRLQNRKRLELAFEIFARLQGKIPDSIQFDVVGAGEPEHDLRQLAAQLGIAHKVHFHGRVIDNDVLATFFSRAIAYISPGPVGLGVLHSFAFGVPVITLREGRHGPEFLNLIDNYNALVVAHDVAYEAALLQICNQPQLAQRLGQNAYRRYADERTLDHLIAGFRQAIESKNTGSQIISAFG
jgi:glycosyltransferase involved in cell wall biosynthesis